MYQYIDLLILAKKATHAAAEASSGSDAKSYSLSWAVVGLGLIVGLLVTLAPTKRSTEVKKSKHD